MHKIWIFLVFYDIVGHYVCFYYTPLHGLLVAYTQYIGVLVDVLRVEYVFTQKGASCADVADSIYI